MEQFFAEKFHILGWVLGFTEGFGLFCEKEDHFAPKSIEQFLGRLKDGKRECETIGLRVCAIHFDEVIKRLDTSGSLLKREEIADIAKELHDSVNREMRAMTFFRLSPDKRHYFDIADGFGKEVAGAFPSADYDIRESGSCLALGRATACVYHSMRVLEHGLCALADQFGLPFEHKSWNDIIEPIEKSIREIKTKPKKPKNWKANEQFYSEAAVQFMYFKNAWRNYTAHKQFKYTEAEAEAIFRHVRDFMRHLAKRLKEKKSKH